MKVNLDKKEILLIDSAEPNGSNKLTSRAAFLQGKLYHQNSFNKIKDNLFEEPVNFNYDSLFYGRVDAEKTSIFAKPENLSQVDGYPGELLNLNFAVDAFNNFLSYWNLSKAKGLLKEGELFYTIKSINGYVDPKQSYFNYLSKQYSLFLDYLVGNKYINKILNFQDFVLYFSKYVDQKITLIPFTFSSFCISKFSDPRISGLIFEMSDQTKDNDNKKYKNFINNVNYPFFYNSAVKYGFSIDKKVPWRLIANIDSPKMKEYILKYKTIEEDFYSKMYSKGHMVDLDYLEIFLKSSYLDFINENEEIDIKYPVICKNGSYKIKNKTTFRDPSIPSNVGFLVLRMYVFLRGRENNLNWNQNSFESLLRKLQQIYLELDLSAAMRYLETVLDVEDTSKITNKTFSY